MKATHCTSALNLVLCTHESHFFQFCVWYLVALSVILISKERHARVSTGGVSRICKNGDTF